MNDKPSLLPLIIMLAVVASFAGGFALGLHQAPHKLSAAHFTIQQGPKDLLIIKDNVTGYIHVHDSNATNKAY